MTKKRNKRHKTQCEKKLAESTKSTNQVVETKADIVTARAPVVTQCVEPKPQVYYWADPKVMSSKLPLTDADQAASDNKCLKNQVEDYAHYHRGEPQIDPVCGLKKFYKNEFEAFEKYFIKIHSHPVDNPIFNAISREVLKLSDQPTCSLTMQYTGDPYKLEFFREPFNVKYPPVLAPNKIIEFAHASIKIAEKDLKGRCLVSTTQLEPHTVLISEKATICIYMVA
ncbi:uncharacterized protein LOC109534281 [Dendroctonus ponderosae]|uniref:uncharacterized protein LOC109534281 n=1 Tax=Dendroctonus ponderosae TaxID=77166 RepID=UPI002034CDD6|nr:uncharacterized protein LOC109534281 [Dendroctonus ponderosae]